MTHTTHEAHNDCIFCKIIAGQVPALKVYEDDSVLAFLDIKPNHPGHTLVIPKDHIENIYGMPDETLCRITMVVRKVALAVKNGVDADGLNIIMNNESAAGQEVFHAHIHIIPRYNEDGFKHWPHQTYVQGQAEEVLEKIRTEIQTQ